MSCHDSGSAHFTGSVKHGLDNFVVAGATAKVACKPETHFFFGWIRITFEQSYGRNQRSWRTDTALKCRVLKEFTLQNVQLRAIGHPFNSLNRFAVRLDTEHQAGANHTAVERYATGAAIAGSTAFFGTCHVEIVTQNVQKRLLRFAQKFYWVTVNDR